MTVGIVENLVICTVPVSPCPPGNDAVISALVLDPTQLAAIDALLAQGPLDWNIVYQAFGYSLLCFGVGAGFGMIINVVRKLR